MRSFGLLIAALFLSAGTALGEETLWIELEWESTREAVAYRVEISDQKSFRRRLRRVKVKATSIALEIPRRSEYYWRVAAIDPEGAQHRFSAAERLEGLSEISSQKLAESFRLGTPNNLTFLPLGSDTSSEFERVPSAESERERERALSQEEPVAEIEAAMPSPATPEPLSLPAIPPPTDLVPAPVVPEPPPLATAMTEPEPIAKAQFLEETAASTVVSVSGGAAFASETIASRALAGLALHLSAIYQTPEGQEYELALKQKRISFPSGSFDEISAEYLSRRLLKPFGLPLTVGIRAALCPGVNPLAVDDDPVREAYFPLLAGFTLIPLRGAHFRVELEPLIELAPVGGVRGMGGSLATKLVYQGPRLMASLFTTAGVSQRRSFSMNDEARSHVGLSVGVLVGTRLGD